MPRQHFDVIIIGAGLSGIGAGYHLQTGCPGKTYAILEARDSIGGTWDLFRYPGVRSDSDMFTLGYAFRPWAGAKAMADGASILTYIKNTAATFNITAKIRFKTRVKHAAWSSATATWTLEIENAPAITCNFLYACCGYYDYAAGYTPDFPGIETFTGLLIHPQKWPEHLSTAGKKIIVIGSGATAVTLVPALAATAAHVTMLQRSPSYVASLPATDATADTLRKYLPGNFGSRLARFKNIALHLVLFNLARRRPAAFSRRIIGLAQTALGPDYDVATHFTPKYNPWDQRLCLVPDADLFRALKSGQAEMVTDEITTFTPTGPLLKSGRELAADIIVTATGLSVQIMGGMTLTVDGTVIDPASTIAYKGIMFSDIPNLAFALGYTNASWTLKCDLTGAYVSRLLNYMHRHNYDYCVAEKNLPASGVAPLIDFSSGYVLRAAAILPRQGTKKPWRLYQNYIRDLLTLKYGALKDGTLKFARRQG